MRITLDTNCIIDLEENRSPADFVKQLVALHNAQKISLRTVAISASETKLDKTYATNFAEFQRKIAAVGLEHMEILHSIAYYGVTFFERCLWADQTMVDQEEKIHAVLFPKMKFLYRDYCIQKGIDPEAVPQQSVWRNAKCDVLAMWSHIHFHGNIFVTSDFNFLNSGNKTQLIALGAGDIMNPKKTVEFLQKRLQ